MTQDPKSLDEDTTFRAQRAALYLFDEAKIDEQLIAAARLSPASGALWLRPATIFFHTVSSI